MSRADGDRLLPYDNLGGTRRTTHGDVPMRGCPVVHLAIVLTHGRQPDQALHAIRERRRAPSEVPQQMLSHGPGYVVQPGHLQPPRYASHTSEGRCAWAAHVRMRWCLVPLLSSPLCVRTHSPRRTVAASVGTCTRVRTPEHAHRARAELSVCRCRCTAKPPSDICAPTTAGTTA